MKKSAIISFSALGLIIITVCYFGWKGGYFEETTYAKVRIEIVRSEYDDPNTYYISIETNSDLINKHGDLLEKFDENFGNWNIITFHDDELNSQKTFVNSLTVKKLEEYYQKEEAKEKTSSIAKEYKKRQKELEKLENTVLEKTIH